MIVPDVNILVYAYNGSAPFHRKALDWWEATVNKGTPIGVCWPVFQGFVRLLGGRRVVVDPYSAEELFAIAEQWWIRPTVRLLAPTEATYAHFRSLMESYDLTGNMATDALIASFALEHRATLVTNDTDFQRFKELRLNNPLD